MGNVAVKKRQVRFRSNIKVDKQTNKQMIEEGLSVYEIGVLEDTLVKREVQYLKRKCLCANFETPLVEYIVGVPTDWKPIFIKIRIGFEMAMLQCKELPTRPINRGVSPMYFAGS